MTILNRHNGCFAECMICAINSSQAYSASNIIIHIYSINGIWDAVDPKEEIGILQEFQTAIAYVNNLGLISCSQNERSVLATKVEDTPRYRVNSSAISEVEYY